MRLRSQTKKPSACGKALLFELIDIRYERRLRRRKIATANSSLTVIKSRLLSTVDGFVALATMIISAIPVRSQ